MRVSGNDVKRKKRLIDRENSNFKIYSPFGEKFEFQDIFASRTKRLGISVEFRIIHNMPLFHKHNQYSRVSSPT